MSTKNENEMLNQLVSEDNIEATLSILSLDNMIKGASGQAVQNMNIMFGLDEKMGLELVPSFP